MKNMKIVGWQPKRTELQRAKLPTTASEWILAIYHTREDAERHGYGGMDDEHPLHEVRPLYIYNPE